MFFMRRSRGSTAFHEYRPEDALRQIGAKAGLPVIFRGDGTGSHAQRPRQRRPQHHEIQMACVICKVDSLVCLWAASLPTHLDATKAPREPRDDSRERMNAGAHFAGTEDFTSRSACHARLKIV